ncbi:MAG: ATP-binding protein [Campylobacterales bacterium]|nr:ATP-binding protein [Campylobacterales bacterium]
MFKNIFLSNIDIDRNSQEYRQLVMINLMLYLAAGVFSSFSIINVFITHYYYMAAVDFLLFFPAAFAIYKLRATKDIERAATNTAILLFISMIMVLVVAKAGDFTILWSFLFAFFIFVIKGYKEGLKYGIAFFIIVYTLSYNWIGDTLTATEFSRYVAVSLCLVAISYFYEKNVFLALSDLSESSQKVKDLIDHSEEGFLSFDRNLIINNEYSKECVTLFKEEIKEKNLADLLFPNDNHKRDFFIETFQGMENINHQKAEIIFSLLQKDFTINKRSVEVKYKYLSNKKFMAILTDVTAQKNLEKKINQEHKILQMIVATVTNKDEFFDIVDSYELFLEKSIKTIDEKKTAFSNTSKLYREIHTFKGLFIQKNFVHTPDKLHLFEEELSKFLEDRETRNEDLIELIKSIDLQKCLHKDLEIIKRILGEKFFDERGKLSVDEETINNIENMVKEFIHDHKESKEFLSQVIDNLEKLKTKPFIDLFSSYPKMVEEISLRLEKNIYPLEIVGNEEITVSDNYKPFVKSLIHIFRNSVDHGIEFVDGRSEKNKSQYGTISCMIKEEDGKYHIIIGDDGVGIDIDLIKEKAIEKELFTEEKIKKMSDKEILEIIFHDNFSTKDVATQYSGRGAGLAAVKSELEELNGEVAINTKPDNGTTFHFTLPAGL